ncbi:hypothetical protein ABPG74_001651 [Tetrahymena malaccensis]
MCEHQSLQQVAIYPKKNHQLKTQINKYQINNFEQQKILKNKLKMSSNCQQQNFSDLLFGQNQFLQDQYQRESCEIETMMAVISQASDLQILQSYKRDPIHFIFIIDDPLFFQYYYLEQFKCFLLSQNVKKMFLTNQVDQQDVFSIFISSCQDKENDFIPLTKFSQFANLQNDDSFYQIFNQNVLQDNQFRQWIQSAGNQEQLEENPEQKLEQVFNLALNNCSDLKFNNSVVFVSSMISATKQKQFNKQKFNQLKINQNSNYNFKFHAISLRKNSFQLLQKLTSSSLGYYFYAKDVEKQLFLYSLDQILILHSKTHLKNYKIELQIEDSHNIIKQISNSSKWELDNNNNSGQKHSYKIQQKYFTSNEEKISLVSVVLNPTNNLSPGVYKVGRVVHSFQIPDCNEFLSFTNDVIITLSNETVYNLNSQPVVFYEQCIFIQLGLKILQSLLQFDWAQVDQFLPRLRDIFSLYVPDSLKFQNLLKSSKYLLERIVVFKQSFSISTKSSSKNHQREIISQEDCYNQIFKMIEYLHNINHFLINLS